MIVRKITVFTDNRTVFHSLSVKRAFLRTGNDKDENMRNLLTLMAGAMILTGCFQTGESALGPGETLETFYTSLFSGDFEGAESLCDTLVMKEYIGNVQDRWNQTDSSVMAIVPAILSETSLDVTDIVKNGQERTVFYELTAADGTSREKIATLRNEEGAWKIKAITDRH